MGSITRSTRLRVALSSLFQAVQAGLGINVTPSHFYFPVPKLKSFRSKNWSACRPCAALDFKLPEQIERLQKELLPFAGECDFPEGPVPRNHAFHFNNGHFERVGAEVAYSFVRQRRPKRVIEVGNGNSTLVLAAAIRENAADEDAGDLISIEPHLAPFLKDGVPGLARLIEKPVQQVPIALFRSLEAGDLLFIDSTHVVAMDVVAMDNDVLYECLECFRNWRRACWSTFTISSRRWIIRRSSSGRISDSGASSTCWRPFSRSTPHQGGMVGERDAEISF